MKKEEKSVIIDALAEQLKQNSHFYLADASGLNAENTTKLRRICFEKKVKMLVVKNTLLRKALEQNNFEGVELMNALEGPTAVMFTEVGNVPAKLIKEFSAKYGKPVLKGAYVQECLYVGAETLTELVNIKSREELLGDIVGMLLAPVRNIVSGLQERAEKLADENKLISERPE
ncbi:MAG: 50S ribosomal protein L10 [Bacteroidales bacterium]|nr:50S ribosomal protein L10 [Bacteroidales bacterium]MCL2133580.1 50S ribosomal protein L10 [Bacteroidales bacterium]